MTHNSQGFLLPERKAEEVTLPYSKSRLFGFNRGPFLAKFCKKSSKIDVFEAPRAGEPPQSTQNDPPRSPKVFPGGSRFFFGSFGLKIRGLIFGGGSEFGQKGPQIDLCTHLCQQKTAGPQFDKKVRNLAVKRHT